MKENILKLREEGKTYQQIANELNCSKSVVCYHCGKDQKEKSKTRNKKVLKNKPIHRKIDDFKGKNARKTKVYSFQKRGKPQKRPTFGIKEVIEKFGENPTCYLTGRQIDLNDSGSYEFDHIIPVSKGGDSSLQNLGLTCKDANQAKRAMMNTEFFTLCKEVLEHAGYKVLNPDSI